MKRVHQEMECWEDCREESWEESWGSEVGCEESEVSVGEMEYFGKGFESNGRSAKMSERLNLGVDDTARLIQRFMDYKHTNTYWIHNLSTHIQHCKHLIQQSQHTLKHTLHTPDPTPLFPHASTS
eukprot:TRINITY_DN18987_c0_g1_i1.p1 TRINITY_DN18987_c0_g1~~TRINITY_DN18987_c0_g1_i1.p1  ORF type:complete len:125 (+),score=31.74 TRINITY_DN18987_c0_g1_i1:3-377(+)